MRNGSCIGAVARKQPMEISIKKLRKRLFFESIQERIFFIYGLYTLRIGRVPQRIQIRNKKTAFGGFISPREYCGEIFEVICKSYLLEIVPAI